MATGGGIWVAAGVATAAAPTAPITSCTGPCTWSSLRWGSLALGVSDGGRSDEHISSALTCNDHEWAAMTEGPEAFHPVLENLQTSYPTARPPYTTLSQVVSRFMELYPQGFYGEKLRERTAIRRPLVEYAAGRPINVVNPEVLGAR